MVRSKRANWRQPVVYGETTGRRTTRAARSSRDAAYAAAVAASTGGGYSGHSGGGHGGGGGAMSAASTSMSGSAGASGSNLYYSSRRQASKARREKDGTVINVSMDRAPVKNWIQVSRPPAPGVKFIIPVWVPVEDLTPKERVKYLPPPKESDQEEEEEEESDKEPEAAATAAESQTEQSLSPMEGVQETADTASLLLENSSKVPSNDLTTAGVITGKEAVTTIADLWPTTSAPQQLVADTAPLVESTAPPPAVAPVPQPQADNTVFQASTTLEQSSASYMSSSSLEAPPGTSIPALKSPPESSIGAMTAATTASTAGPEDEPPAKRQRLEEDINGGPDTASNF